MVRLLREQSTTQLTLISEETAEQLIVGFLIPLLFSIVLDYHFVKSFRDGKGDNCVYKKLNSQLLSYGQ